MQACSPAASPSAAQLSGSLLTAAHTTPPCPLPPLPQCVAPGAGTLPCTTSDPNCASCNWMNACYRCKAGWSKDAAGKVGRGAGGGRPPAAGMAPGRALLARPAAAMQHVRGSKIMLVASASPLAQCTVVVDTQKCRALVPNCVSCKTWDYARCRTCASGYSLNSYGQVRARAGSGHDVPASGWARWLGALYPAAALPPPLATP